MTKKITKFCVLIVILYFFAALLGGGLALYEWQSLKGSTESIVADQQGLVNLFRQLRLMRLGILPIEPMLRLTRWSIYLENMDSIITAEPVLTELGGYEKAKTFLLVFQNNTEIRPSGGFWGSYGIVTVENGQIKSLKTDDTYNIDTNLTGQFTPPEDVASVFRDEWRFWNANWSPDFKLSVEQGLYFYKQAHPEVVFDGVIGPNIDYVTSLLGLTGPIKLDGYDFTLDESNFLQKMVLEPMNPSSTQALGSYVKNDQKNFVLADVSNALSATLLDSRHFKNFATVTYEALKDRDLQLYFSSANVQKATEELAWAGRVNCNGNFIMPVDANLGSKLDFVIDKSVRIKDLGNQRYQATLTYRNTLDPNDTNHIFKVYRDYLRLYLPRDAQIVERAGGEDTSEIEYQRSLELSAVSFLLVLKPGEGTTITITWNTAEKGDLYIYKQSGSHLNINI